MKQRDGSPFAPSLEVGGRSGMYTYKTGLWDSLFSSIFVGAIEPRFFVGYIEVRRPVFGTGGGATEGVA